jgi:hypothetical protein
MLPGAFLHMSITPSAFRRIIDSLLITVEELCRKVTLLEAQFLII